MIKSLYDDQYHYTEEADSLDHKTAQVCRDLFNEVVKKGYSPREVSQIMQASINMLELGHMLDIQYEGSHLYSLKKLDKL